MHALYGPIAIQLCELMQYYRRASGAQGSEFFSWEEKFGWDGGWGHNAKVRLLCNSTEDVCAYLPL